MINYQAVLLDPAGKPLRNDTATVSFRIYDDSTATDVELWTETVVAETDKSGSFSVLLGSDNPVPDTLFAEPDRWLALAVRSDPEMTPRTRLVSVPYAYHSLRSDTAAFALSSGDGWTDDGSIVRLTTTADSVGIGTKQPQHSLHVLSTASQQVKIEGDGQAARFVLDGDGGTGADVIYQVNGNSEWSTSWSVSDAGFVFAEDDDNLKARMIIKDGGKVGIGTTNPGEKLSVAGLVESTSGGFKFPDGSIQTTATSVGGITVMTGTVAHNTLIAPPPGYSVAQCKCIVSPHTFGPSGSSQEAFRHWCYVTQEAGGWRVYAMSQNAHYGGFDPDIANYMIIGVK
jgi:hypothetical protein